MPGTSECIVEKVQQEEFLPWVIDEELKAEYPEIYDDDDSDDEDSP